MIPPLRQPGKGPPRAFTSLRQRNFRLFWFGQMISLPGSYIQSVGEVWLVLALTHSPFQLGLVGALQALPVLPFAMSRLYPLSLALIASVGGAEIAFTTLAVTMLQTVAPDHLRGRVMSVAILSFDGSLPLGYLLMGWLASRYEAPSALFIGAMLNLLVVGAGWLWHNQLIATRVA